ncbi:hypothetical protein DL93DRAFT_2164776 [Clavulina sp. PMI_390]|nr:hypothetical protein DL93DRAFT_2164776 [Clavulina sp. PMI_390]
MDHRRAMMDLLAAKVAGGSNRQGTPSGSDGGSRAATPRFATPSTTPGPSPTSRTTSGKRSRSEQLDLDDEEDGEAPLISLRRMPAPRRSVDVAVAAPSTRTSPARAASTPMPATTLPYRHTTAEVTHPIPSPPSPDAPITIDLGSEDDDLLDEDIEVEKGKECVVCRDSKSDESYPTSPPTTACTHAVNVCKQCMERHIEAEVNGKGETIKITCPVCRSNLEYNDVQRGASAAIFKRYDDLLLRKSLQAMEDFRWCKNAEARHHSTSFLLSTPSIKFP